jgi:hypothetical protein
MTRGLPKIAFYRLILAVGAVVLALSFFALGIIYLYSTSQLPYNAKFKIEVLTLPFGIAAFSYFLIDFGVEFNISKMMLRKLRCFFRCIKDQFYGSK